MKVYFDSTCLMTPELTGVGVYAQQTFLHLKKHHKQLKPVFKGSRSLSLNCIENHIGEPATAYWSFLQDSFHKKNTLFHGPDFRMICQNRKVKRVVTVHDLVVFHEGYNDSRFRERGQKAMNILFKKIRPDHIIVPSLTVKNEVLERYPEYSDKVTAIYHGGNHLTTNLIEEVDGGSAPFKKQNPYFLFIGHLENRKNVERIIKGFEIFCERHKDYSLVLIGKDGFGAQGIHQQIAGSRFKKQIQFKGYLTSCELKQYYQNATGFVFPSLYEGFGFPLIEAMLASCPVITSHYGAMKEVAEEAACFVDPLNVESIAHGMAQMTDKGLRSSLIEKGLKRGQFFQWEKSASKVYEVYLNLLL